MHQFASRMLAVTCPWPQAKPGPCRNGNDRQSALLALALRTSRGAAMPDAARRLTPCGVSSGHRTQWSNVMQQSLASAAILVALLVMPLPDARLRAQAGTWADLGSGLSGTNGVPSLVGTGMLGAGSTGSLTLTSARPLSPGAMLVSLASAPTPFKGGMLMPTPSRIPAWHHDEPRRHFHVDVNLASRSSG